VSPRAVTTLTPASLPYGSRQVGDAIGWVRVRPMPARLVEMTLEHTNVIGIAIAALGGAAVGLEREWSGQAGRREGPLCWHPNLYPPGWNGGCGWLALDFRIPDRGDCFAAGATALVVAA